MSENLKPPAKKLRELPHIFVLLFCVLVLATIATHIIPAGQYARVMDEGLKRTVIDPTSFKYVKDTPVGLFNMFVSLEP